MKKEREKNYKGEMRERQRGCVKEETEAKTKRKSDSMTEKKKKRDMNIYIDILYVYISIFISTSPTTNAYGTQWNCYACYCLYVSCYAINITMCTGIYVKRSKLYELKSLIF